MTVRHTPSPSPPVGPVGEGAERAFASEAGEGALERNPSPGRSLRLRPPSPIWSKEQAASATSTTAEGREQAARLSSDKAESR